MYRYADDNGKRIAKSIGSGYRNPKVRLRKCDSHRNRFNGIARKSNHWEAILGKPTRPPSAQADGSDLRPKGIKRQRTTTLELQEFDKRLKGSDQTLEVLRG